MTAAARRDPSVWTLGCFLAQAAVAIVWVPTFVFQPVGTAVDEDLLSIVALMTVFVGPMAWGSGLIAGRTRDDRRRFRWLAGFGLVAAVGGWLIVAFAGDVFACGGQGVAPTEEDVVCASSLWERVTGLAMVEAMVVGQWILARGEWRYHRG